MCGSWPAADIIIIYTSKRVRESEKRKDYIGTEQKDPPPTFPRRGSRGNTVGNHPDPDADGLGSLSG